MKPARRHFRLSLFLAVVASACLSGRRTRLPDAPEGTPSAPAAKRDTARQPEGVRADTGKVPRRDTASVAPIAKDSAASSPTPKKPATKKAAAKPKECLLDFADSPPETRMRYQRLPDSTGLTFIGGGFVGHCQGDKNSIRADSAEHYQGSGILNLFGNVVYTEPGRLQFNAQHATYFTREERINADGAVHATQLASGSTYTSSSIEYLRPLPGVRASSRLTSPGRSSASIVEKDSTGQPGPPVVVAANTMVDDSDSVIYAWGDVQINRLRLIAESDSASFLKATERARLIRNARVDNRDKAEPFRLFGDTIDLYSTERKLNRVVARHKGVASSNDVVMRAEILDLRIADQQLERAYASGTGRATATTSSQSLEADSIAVRMPKQKIRELRAIGRAIATGVGDTTKIKSTDRDILRGDTVIAWFDSAAARADTGTQASVTEIHAIGSASSLFRMASKDGPNAPPALNYIRGVVLQVHFDSGEVRRVTMDSAATGWYLEPVADSLSDSTTKSPSPRSPALPAKRPPTPQAPDTPPSVVSTGSLIASRRRS